jgi:ubiquinone/menaquinone biosynthesis C-methylase UbiE
LYAMKKEVQKRVWGETETRGGRQLFRQGLLLSTFMRHVPAGRVLDAGCGDGSLTKELLKNDYKVVAVDASKLAVNRLKEKVKGSGKESDLEFHVSEMDRIEEPDSSFDGIICGEVLEHIQDDRAVAREFFRLLKPGGFCVVTVPADPDKWSFVDEWAGHFRRYNRDGLAGIFEKAGFQIQFINHWGWPTLTLYDRFLFRTWAKGSIQMTGKECEELKTTRLFQKPVIAKIMAAFFSIDRLFLKLPLGIGLIGVFHKAAEKMIDI